MSMLTEHRTRINKAVDYVRTAAQFRSPLSQMLDLIIHKVKINTSLPDYYNFGFYKVKGQWEEKSRYVGRRGSRYWPYENNELRYNALFTRKYLLKALLRGFGLPTPKLLATIGLGFEITNRKELDAFLDTLASDIAIKPNSGSWGTNVLVLRNDNGHFMEVHRTWSREAIWSHIKKDFNRGFLVEERVYNTPHIQAMYPHSLNTFRVVTIKTRDNKWHVALCFLKVGTGTSTVDNIGSGGLIVALDNTGKTTHAYDPQRLMPLTRHPDTGVALVDIQLKEYHEVLNLALEGSRKFSFMGTIGWDIASTTKGTLIIEGNLFWGITLTQVLMGPVITSDIAKGLRKRNVLTKWDKNKMYPGFDKRI